MSEQPKIKATIKSKKPAKIKAKIRQVPKRVPLPAPTETQIDDVLDDELLSFPLYDLRNSGGVHDSLDANQKIVQMLDDLISHTVQIKAAATGRDKANQQRRINSFIRARDGIKEYTNPIKSGAQAQKEIDGVGKGIATRIQEFINTGKLAELESTVTPEAKLIMELTEITGIGEVKAKSLITDHGVISVDDLIQKYRDGQLKIGKNELTHHIAVGLDYYHDLKQRMAWDEADKIAKAITENIMDLDSKLIVKVCGSYRRHKPTCGDLDVLVTQQHQTITLPDIVSKLESVGILTGHLTTKGKTKYMGVCRGPSGVGRRIDIRYVNYDSLGAAMLYFTGSGKFNKIMRYHANVRGYTLNEYGLYTYINNVKGESPIPAPAEEDIFRKLGFVYLKPTEREF